MIIKNIDDLKKVQIVCRNQEQVKDCLNYLEQLEFKISYLRFNYHCIIFYEINLCSFCATDTIHSDLLIEFYNKELVKTLQKFIKEKQEKKEKVADFEIAEDGRIIKINNLKSEQKIYTIYGTEIDLYHLGFVNEMISLGSLYATAKARDKAKFKMEIETKLKNIAERLNNGRKFDWDDTEQEKYFLVYRPFFNGTIFLEHRIDFLKIQGTIYCLDKNFLDVAKKEIGEENLIKYFKE